MTAEGPWRSVEYSQLGLSTTEAVIRADRERETTDSVGMGVVGPVVRQVSRVCMGIESKQQPGVRIVLLFRATKLYPFSEGEFEE